MLEDIKAVNAYRADKGARQKFSVSDAEFIVLNHLANRLPEGASILEVGSYKFASTLAFIEALESREDLRLTTIDPAYKNLGLLDTLSDSVQARIKVITGPSQKHMPRLTEKFDLIFVDGDHVYEAVDEDLYQAKRLRKEGGTIAAHDVEWRYVGRAWTEKFPVDSYAFSDDPWAKPVRLGQGHREHGKRGVAVHPVPLWLTADYWEQVRDRTG